MPFPTADEVIQAYREGNLKPTARFVGFINGGPCCAIGALCQDEPPGARVDMFAVRYGLCHDEALAFATGFDEGFEGNTPTYIYPPLIRRLERFRDAYTHGIEVGKRVREAFPKDQAISSH